LSINMICPLTRSAKDAANREKRKESVLYLRPAASFSYPFHKHGRHQQSAEEAQILLHTTVETNS